MHYSPRGMRLWDTWYLAHGGNVDCRDLIVVPDAAGGGWLGFYAARTPPESNNEMAETAVIACVRSTDLIRWEPLPLAFAAPSLSSE